MSVSREKHKKIKNKTEQGYTVYTIGNCVLVHGWETETSLFCMGKVTKAL